MKKFKIVILLFLSSLVFTSCGGDVPKTGAGISNKTQITGKIDNDNYRSVIQHGHYLTSKTRGLTNNQDQNNLDVKSFESGLLDISKKQFSTKKYIFQEGQYISSAKAQDWLERKSHKNPEGLNPFDKKSPIYLQSIEEQDYMKQSGKKLKLSGMTIGLSLNSVYYYDKGKSGTQESENISDQDLINQGENIANKVIKRVRQIKGVSDNLPVVIALYKQSSEDSLVGGTFVKFTVNKGGSIINWHNVNERNEILPSIGGDNSNNDHSTISRDFDDFKNQVQNFFPNLSGVVAQVHYTNDNLSGMNITITTQFYSETEIISFTQYIAQIAPKYLPGGVPINITVQSTNGIQSFLSRKQNQTKFYSHVFTSY